MPGGVTLGEAKLRGVRSSGMILSAAELEIGEDSGGIMVLDDGLAPGSPLAAALPLAEPVLELEVTPNRVDCLGVYGVAREVHAVTAAPLGPAPWAEDAPAEGEGEAGDYASVAVEVPELCPRFTARVFTDVEVGPSPAWLQARLKAAGQRPINNVVDVTNYTMLLTAQPLHAFDLDRVPGGALTVRAAAEGEAMTTLDGVERVFDAETVLVCDRSGPSGIAGVMGGQVSEVSDETTRVLLEVANWNGTNILRTSRLLGLRSEASARFEKQLHPELCMRAQRVASRLLVELCGARLVPGTIDVAAALPEPPRVRLRGARVEGLLGMRIEQADQVAYLERLGFGVEADGEDLVVEVPPDRHHDVTREVDLIEEVARVHGLDEHLPATLPGAIEHGRRADPRAAAAAPCRGRDARPRLRRGRRLELHRSRRGGAAADPRGRPARRDGRRLQPALRGAVGDAHDAARLAARRRSRNLARDADRVALFESGRVYLPSDGAEDGPLAGRFAGERPAPAAEPHRLGCLAVGPLAAKSWRGWRGGRGLLRAEGRAGGAGGAARRRAGVRAGARSPSCTRAARRASRSAGAPPAGSASCTRSSAASGTSTPAGGLRSRAGGAGRGRRRRRGDLRGRRPLPGRLPGPRGRRARLRSRPRGCAMRSSPGAASCCARREVFDLYEGEQLGEGRKSLALRLEFRAERPHPHRRGGRRRSARRSRRSWRRSEGRSVSDA